MDKKLTSVTVIAFLVFSVIVFPQLSYCQTDTPTPTDEPPQDVGLDLMLIGVVVAVVAVVVGVSVFVLVKRRKVNEKSLRKFSASAFEEWVLGRFNGTPSDPTTGLTGFTQGGQPLLIKQSDNVSLSEVEGFVKVLVKGKAQKGTVVAFGFDKDAVEAKLTAMDNEIELQLLPIYELLNKRYAKRIVALASASVTFNAAATENAPVYVPALATAKPGSFDDFERMPTESPRVGVKPRVFISNSNSQVADQVKRMLDFLHYEYDVGDREDASVPISDKNLSLMKNCDCAVINIAAAEQERRYSGLYILNSNVTSAINAAYLKYNAQVVLLVERKIDLPSNLKGLRKIDYDSDELSFNAAMDLEKILAEYKKI
ncbi:MAG TPA: hypothetical protein VLL96_04855 [Candidatus Deferrimicrobiaceae bacterium]|nr:hypothetical protein [Candidatus Deferrimicrobiaceae bacterium]